MDVKDQSQDLFKNRPDRQGSHPPGASDEAAPAASALRVSNLRRAVAEPSEQRSLASVSRIPPRLFRGSELAALWPMPVLLSCCSTRLLVELEPRPPL